MKIGILTFHRAKNYGAMLQCYALLSFLQSLKYAVFVLDYKPDYLAGARDNGFLWSLKKYIRFIMYRILSKGEVKNADAFNSFVDQHLKLLPINESQNLDAIVCGSDQIWSTKICGNLDQIYFGKLSDGKAIKRISYAASNGNVQLTPQQQMEFKKLLQEMNAISVRESTLQDYLNKLGLNSKLVLDPVLLAGKKHFEAILCPIKQKKPYVLIYELTHLESTYKLANKIAKVLDADILVMAGEMKRYFQKGIINKGGLTPAQFVSYFKEAVCVVTTSFHGTAFSIVYERPFYSMYMNSDRDDRILSLLSELNLMERSVRNVDDISFTPIDYHKVNPRLESLRIESKNFLINALNCKNGY